MSESIKMSVKSWIESPIKRKLLVLAIQLGLCTAIFFVVAILIFSIRGREEQAFVMPSLLHKSFLNVYDQLQSLDLRVKISRREYKHLPTGLILSQSLSPGEIVHRYDSLHLIINQPHPFLHMPNLLQANLNTARSLLKRIPANGRVYALKIGSISKIYSNDYTHNTIIAQFPLAGELVDLEQSVYFLVAVRSKNTQFPPQEKGKQTKIVEPSQGSRIVDLPTRRRLIGQNIVVATQYFHYRKIDYRIRHLRSPAFPDQLGQVFKITRSRKGVYLLDVYYQPLEKEYPNSSYEKITIELDESGLCVVKNIPIGKDKQREYHEQNIFITQKHDKNEEINILFYRQGAVRIEAWCGDEMVYDRELYPDDIS